MKFLLRLRHWQLFLLTWGLPIMLTFFNTGLPFDRVFLVMMIFFTLGIFGWVWAISTELRKKLAADVKLNLAQFKVLFAIPVVYILGITIWTSSGFFVESPLGIRNMGVGVGMIIIILHVFSMVCIFFGIRFAAKTMKSVELGRMASFGDYAGEFFLIWFSFAGVWILQPRLNKLIKGPSLSYK